MSIVSESQPCCAMVSALNESGIDSHPFTAAPPAFQIERMLFARVGLARMNDACHTARLLRDGLLPPDGPSTADFRRFEVGVPDRLCGGTNGGRAGLRVRDGDAHL